MDPVSARLKIKIQKQRLDKVVRGIGELQQCGSQFFKKRYFLILIKFDYKSCKQSREAAAT